MSLFETVKELDLLATARYRMRRGVAIDLRVYRNAEVKLKPSAAVTGGGALHVGMRWPAFRGNRTVLAVWDEASLTVATGFALYSGCRVVVDQGARLELGSGYINCNSVISCFRHVSIGEGTAISENAMIRDSDNHMLIGSPHPQSAPIMIGNHVWVGMNVTILKGVTIGDGAIIAAGAVVNKSIPPRCLAAGVPAKVIRQDVHWK